MLSPWEMEYCFLIAWRVRKFNHRSISMSFWMVTVNTTEVKTAVELASNIGISFYCRYPLLIVRKKSGPATEQVFLKLELHVFVCVSNARLFFTRMSCHQVISGITVFELRCQVKFMKFPMNLVHPFHITAHLTVIHYLLEWQVKASFCFSHAVRLLTLNLCFSPSDGSMFLKGVQRVPSENPLRLFLDQPRH